MLTPNPATSGGERFALRCGGVHASVPLRSAEVSNGALAARSCLEGGTHRVFAQPRHYVQGA